MTPAPGLDLGVLKAVSFDAVVERGGTAFDTAYVYGPADVLLGRWIRDRGVRDDVA